MKTRNIVRAINSVKTAKEKLEKMNRMYPKRYKDELEDVGKAVTAKWYASYDRLFYRPIESLFDAFRVNLDGTDFSVEFDSSFMDTGRDNDDYIFENSFMQGYHGGERSRASFAGDSLLENALPSSHFLGTAGASVILPLQPHDQRDDPHYQED